MSWFDANAAVPLFISSISEAELWLGVSTMPEGKRQKELAERIAIMLTKGFAEHSLSFTSDAAFAFGKIFGERKKRGRPIRHADCQIAAIAQVNDLALATRNTSDFEHCGIEVINPWLVQ